MVLRTLQGRAWMRWFRFKTIRNLEFLVKRVLHEFCALCIVRPFDLVVHFLLTRPHPMVLNILQGSVWMHSFRFKTIRNLEFLVMRVLREFRALCALRPFDLVVHILLMRPNTMVLPTHYGRAWKRWFCFKTMRNLELLVMRVLREFRALCALQPFDLVVQFLLTSSRTMVLPTPR